MAVSIGRKRTQSLDASLMPVYREHAEDASVNCEQKTQTE